MKLLMFDDGAGARLGVARDGAPDEIVDVAASNGSSSAGMPATILEVIDAGAEGLDRLHTLASSASAVRALADLKATVAVAAQNKDALLFRLLPPPG